jgi:hypothetical protein
VTVGEWLRAREPRPPAALTARLEEVVGSDMQRDASAGCEVLLAASERLLAQLLNVGATSRVSALDLLVADALVTYAFEAASTDAASIPRHASHAMQRIAELAAEHA